MDVYFFRLINLLKYALLILAEVVHFQKQQMCELTTGRGTGLDYVAARNNQKQTTP